VTLRPRFPPRLFVGLSRALVTGATRSVAADAATLEAALPRRPAIDGVEHLPVGGGVVLVANHCQRPGLWIGWAGAAITAAVRRHRSGDPPVRWTVVADVRVGSWRLPGSDWLFRGVARAWTMVPMPTATGDVRGRASALRRLETLVRAGAVVGIFPEGAGGRAGVPGDARPGVGRWLRRQAEAGAAVVPVAVAERDGALAVRFGRPLSPAEAADPMPHLRRLYAELQPRRSTGRRGLGRWGRAKRLLRPEERLVVDAGCAFGFGTARLGPEHGPVGVERDARYVEQARRRCPSLPLVRGDVTALPIRSGAADAVLLLDVLEHLPEPAAAVAEARRVLRPGGALVVSVPRRGALLGLDALNVYARLAARFGWPPLDPTEASFPEHRHFDERELARLLGSFRIESVERTGLGLAEPPHLALLVLLRGLLRWESAYRAGRFFAFGLSIAEDTMPAGRFAYNLYARAVKCPDAEARSLARADGRSDCP
jgi:SAM-dependent methyltransferase